MFNLEWRELGLLAVVGVFWLAMLAQIYRWWFYGRPLRPAHARADRPS